MCGNNVVTIDAVSGDAPDSDVANADKFNVPMSSRRGKVYDNLIIGSGASGGWVAKELAERGLSVLMLEAGPPLLPTRDFTEHVWPYGLGD